MKNSTLKLLSTSYNALQSSSQYLMASFFNDQLLLKLDLYSLYASNEMLIK